jgi:hypothetical protein
MVANSLCRVQAKRMIRESEAGCGSELDRHLRCQHRRIWRATQRLGDTQIRTCAASSAAYSLREDIFDFFSPIQEREMVEGIGHWQAANSGGPKPLLPPIIPDWMAKQLGA